MIPIITCGFLVLLIFVVHFRGKDRFQKLSSAKPLDQEDQADLPAPWAGHTSSVFSLTALFGAYLGVLLLVGFMAGVGLAIGSTVALLLIRSRLQSLRAESPETTFEAILTEAKWSDVDPLNLGLWLLVVFNLIGFAVSELVILREIAFHTFSMAPQHATVFATLIALSGYYYCLVGGYAAVFRTDVVQLFAILVMCTSLGGYVVWSIWLGESTVFSAHPSVALRSDYWSMPFSLHWVSKPVYQLGIGWIMGMGFLLASPDTWKRVFTILKHEDKSQFNFGALVLAGFVPFLLLVPLLLALPADLVTQLDKNLVIRIPNNSALVSFAVIGMIASFLSSFDSMLVTASHIVLSRSSGRAAIDYTNSIQSYRIFIGALLLAVLLFFLSLTTWIVNPYFLANLLLGPFALAGGLILGTWGFRRRIRTEVTGWLVLVSLAAWLLYYLNLPSVAKAPDPGQIETVPIGAAIFVFFAVVTHITSTPPDREPP